MEEGPLVQRLSVLAGACEPPRDGRLPKAEDAFSRGWVQPFSQRREHHRDLLGGGFQAIQGRVASSAEGGVARLAPEPLDVLGLAMFAIAHQRMDASICLANVGALPVRACEPFGVDAFWCSPPAFHLAPGTHRNRRWLSSRRSRGGESTSGAIVWRARLQQSWEPRAHLGCCS